MIFKSSKKEKKTRFFCESCGKEVPRDAKNCSSCGSAFASVLCPACNFSGKEELFRNGCPSCGYSSKTELLNIQNEASDFPSEKRKSSGSLSIWIYILTAAVFTTILAALFFKVFK